MTWKDLDTYSRMAVVIFVAVGLTTLMIGLFAWGITA